VLLLHCQLHACWDELDSSQSEGGEDSIARLSRLPQSRPSVCSMRATVRYEMPALSARSSRDQFRSARAAFTWRTVIIAIAVRSDVKVFSAEQPIELPTETPSARLCD
jgi:hypothetical protein